MKKTKTLTFIVILSICPMTKVLSQDVKVHRISVDRLIDACLGLEHNSIDELLFFPNPVEDIVTIKLNKNLKDIKFSFYNSLGILVKQGLIETSVTQISTQDLPRGIYVITLECGENQFQTFKIILK